MPKMIFPKFRQRDRSCVVRIRRVHATLTTTLCPSFGPIGHQVSERCVPPVATPVCTILRAMSMMLVLACLVVRGRHLENFLVPFTVSTASDMPLPLEPANSPSYIGELCQIRFTPLVPVLNCICTPT